MKSANGANLPIPSTRPSRRPSSRSLNKDPIIVAGPTGVGKTLFAVELAIRLDGEIIGADAYQVYSGLEVLTSQPAPELQRQAPHHLIGFLSPAEPFDAAQFATLAREKIAEVESRGRQPILVGGSGLYIKALTHGLADLPPPDPVLREELNALDRETLCERLLKADPATAGQIDLQNPRRVMRALEIHLLTGRSISELRSEWAQKERPGFRGLLLTRDPGELKKRIAAQVDFMLAHGAIDEVRQLEKIGPTARMAIGLREIQQLLRGEINPPECAEKVTLATRRYAKRQLTWFRNQFTFPPIDLTGLQTNAFDLSPALQALGEAA